MSLPGRVGVGRTPPTHLPRYWLFKQRMGSQPERAASPLARGNESQGDVPPPGVEPRVASPTWSTANGNH